MKLTSKYPAILFIFSICCLFGVSVSAQSSVPISVAFTNATVVDMKSKRPRLNQTVVIKGDRIVAVGRANRVAIPSEATLVDARGKFLIPGLWDMHVHFWDADVFYPVALANGITGIRDMGDELRSLVAYRRQIADGKRLGPRLFFGGQIIDTLRRENLPFLFDYAATPEKARDFVRARKTAGADFVKVYTMLPREIYEAVADEAKRQNIPVVGHVPVGVGARAAADAGQKSFEHLSAVAAECASDEEQRRRAANDLLNELYKTDRERFQLQGERAKELTARTYETAGKIFAMVSEDALDRYAPQKCRELFRFLRRKAVWQVPTLAVGSGDAAGINAQQTGEQRLRYFPQFVRGLISRSAAASPEQQAIERRRFQTRLQIVRRMRDAGLKILAGSDAPNPGAYPGFGLHDELEFLTLAGFTPFEALRAATRSPAEFFGKTAEMGTIETGKFADLVLLDADPLADIKNTRRIRAVVANGRLLTRETLDKMLAQAEAKHSAPPKQ